MHERHREAEARLARARWRSAARAGRRPYAAEAVAEPLGGRVEVVDDERQAPEAHVAVGRAAELEQARAEDEERLPRAVARVARAAVVEARARASSSTVAVEVGGERDDVVDGGRAVRVLDGAGGGRRRARARPSRSPSEVAQRQPTIPSPSAPRQRARRRARISSSRDA